MKTRLLLACFAMVMASCSNDDNSGKDTSGENSEKILREIVQTEFNPDGSVKLTSKTYFDEDKAVLEEQYNNLNELSAKSEFAYNASGTLESMTHYSAASGLQTPDYGYVLTYDNLGRVVSKKETGTTTASTTFVYTENSTNTITATTTGSGEPVYAVYYINNAGQLYKKTVGSATEELTYSDDNILKYKNESFISDFEYINEPAPLGHQHKIVLNQFKGNAINALLINGFLTQSLGNTKYVAKRTDSNGDAFSYEYQFNAGNYPVKVRCFKNNASIPYSIREVYYE